MEEVNMGFLGGIFGQGLGASNQENDSDVPPSRRQPPDKAEKERIRKHVEKEERKQTPEEQERAKPPPRDGKIM
jgi:hypothetical protein